ncbi:hypothetical protein HYPSUDRAFT_1010990 [Hypholoma sublateritium FD-334 SS-4]|uniref:Uncharacterized protein n=1 Tax=Hypholoma sublateritium (strain FD-334 SS-4) TaxID=945553 RepID=A0A0D2M359_HYPSF|nr:hypothetical protein HYPSUDRAFT_1010990 [Hypholoma sublateritium FD-334 SS-4]
MSASLSATGTTASELEVVSDTGAKELLSSLVAFLKPVIQGYAASPVSAELNQKCIVSLPY